MEAVSLIMPLNCAGIGQEEMIAIEGGKVKTYYNRADTLANTCSIIMDAWLLQSIIYAGPACGISVGPGIVSAYICSKNAEQMGNAYEKCKKYKGSTYITLKIKTSGLVIKSVSTKKGK